MFRKFKIPKPREWAKLIKEQLFTFNQSPRVKAFSVGVGVFIGLTPFWGFHTLIAIGIAVLFRLNKLLTVLSSYISFPPLIPFIIYIQWKAGSLFFVNELPKGMSLTEKIENYSLHYFAGSGLLAVSAGLITGFLVYFLILLKRKHKSIFNEP